MIPLHIKEASKVIGYFSHGGGSVFCDGDACIIAGSEERMQSYLEKMPGGNERDVIKKTRFGEIVEGLRRGGAYAFDEESYKRFLHLATMNGIKGLPTKETFSEAKDISGAMNFVNIRIAG